MPAGAYSKPSGVSWDSHLIVACWQRVPDGGKSTLKLDQVATRSLSMIVRRSVRRLLSGMSHKVRISRRRNPFGTYLSLLGSLCGREHTNSSSMDAVESAISLPISCHLCGVSREDQVDLGQEIEPILGSVGRKEIISLYGECFQRLGSPSCARSGGLTGSILPLADIDWLEPKEVLHSSWPNLCQT